MALAQPVCQRLTAYAVLAIVYKVHKHAYSVNKPGGSGGSRMKALAQHKYGSTKVLAARDVENPEAGARRRDVK